jgi:hypothetical protein
MGHRFKEPIQTLAWKASEGWNEHLFEVPPELMEKFVELIVKECVDTMKEQSYNTYMLLTNPPKSSAVWDARNAIEKKFGVK